MRVELWAYTHMTDAIPNHMDLTENGADTPADILAEAGGRACYSSFNRPNPATRRNKDYVNNILRMGHESVLEHASATFYITGVSRALTHELIRHRHLSFSELSQRFVDMSKAEFVTPPAYRDIEMESPIASNLAECYEGDVADLMEAGYKRKQAREAARCQLPNATETKLVVTGNHRAWRDVLKRRYHVAADAEICELATEILRQLRDIAPNTFQDFPDKPFGSEE